LLVFVFFNFWGGARAFEKRSRANLLLARRANHQIFAAQSNNKKRTTMIKEHQPKQLRRVS